MKQPLVIISGPTACGKTAVSVELAGKINAEIISADSMQVYRHMDIGTAKVTKEEMKGIHHYMIDVLEPDEPFSVAVFQSMAKQAIEDITKNNKLPLVVGGTGYYTNALVYNNNFMSTDNSEQYTEELKKELEEKGNDYIFSILQNIDPEYAAVVHKNNTKRVIKAIAYYKANNEKFSAYNNREKQREAFYDVKWFILNMDRERLYKRIDKRIDIMLENGLIDEVKSLYPKYSRDLVSMQGLGYKEIIAYLENELSLDEAIYILKRDTRHFAKRQLTWYKHQCNDGIWIDMDNFDSAEQAAYYIYENYFKGV